MLNTLKAKSKDLLGLLIEQTTYCLNELLITFLNFSVRKQTVSGTQRKSLEQYAGIGEGESTDKEIGTSEMSCCDPSDSLEKVF